MLSLVVMPNWIGDFMLALSVLTRKLEYEKISLLVSPKLVALAQIFSNTEIIPYRRSTYREYQNTLSGVRRSRFERIYLLPFSFSSAWFAFHSGIAFRRGIAKECRGPLLNSRLPGKIRNRSEHISREYAAILCCDYSPPENWDGVAAKKNKTYRDYIVLCPGATYGVAKRWPYFDTLAEKLTPAPIVLLGKKGDSANFNPKLLAQKNVTDLCGRTDIEEAVSIIASARAVVSNDSGLMHISGYIGTPVISIFGSTSPVWTRPLGNNVRIAYTAEKCSPCFRRSCRYGHYNCLQNISPEYILKLLNQLID